MSNLVATVNGKRIYSDKAIASISNTRVTFMDGSWCDVATGQVSNAGPGYINIDSPQKEEKMTTIGPRSYEVGALSITGVDASIDIQPHDKPYVIVLIEGSEADVEAIRVSQSGNSLSITSDGNVRSGGRINLGGSVITMGSYQRGGISIGQIVGRGRAIVAGGDIVIGGNASSPTKITIQIPSRLPISLAGVMGDVSIGDTDSSLLVSSTASGDVKAGRMSSANLKIQGSGDVDVSEVNGSLDISIMGSGDVNVRGGNVTMLSATVMGSGDIAFSGMADNANLNVMGSGDIWVKMVMNRPSTTVLGSGDIRVLNW